MQGSHESTSGDTPVGGVGWCWRQAGWAFFKGKCEALVRYLISAVLTGREFEKSSR